MALSVTGSDWLSHPVPSVRAHIAPITLWGAKCRCSDWPAHPIGRQVSDWPARPMGRQVLDWPARVMGHQVLRLVRLPYGALSIGALIGPLVLWDAKCQGSDWPARPMGHQVSGLKIPYSRITKPCGEVLCKAYEDHQKQFAWDVGGH